MLPRMNYLKKEQRGRRDASLCDELHEYDNDDGHGDAMAELYGASRCFVGMTATLINGYSSGIFHLLYRIVPGLMLKDGKRYKSPGDFDAEYGVVENTYEIQDAEYNSNRRTSIKPAFFYKTEHGYELLFSFDAKTAKKNIREEID